MDSLTQIALGATLAAAIAPPDQRRRALVYGAALGTLPDLDVLIRYGDPVADFTNHRSFSHSLLVLTALAPLLWLACRQFDAALRLAPRRWLAIFWLTLVTHPLLDAMTIYGTQLLWPFDSTPFGVGSVFIIDPLYTLPLLLAMTWVAWRPLSIAAARSLPWALALSTAYLGWSVIAQRHVEAHARQALANAGEAPAAVLALPSAFNTLLWRVLVREDGGYREAYYSLLADDWPGPWRRFASADDLIPALSGQWAFDRLRWFTHGYYAIHREGDDVVISDLRMGSEPAYVFRFSIARMVDSQPVPAATLQQSPLRPLGKAVGWLLSRVVTPGHALPPPDQVLALPQSK
ncbi:MAG: metal-dependent hydrolase [Rhodanobacteraceae bacterium]|nr:metal-dependent hydrolase [Rhodanobacteraceae bacterium]